MQLPLRAAKDSISNLDLKRVYTILYPHPEPIAPPDLRFKKWKVKTAIGGGPVLVQNGMIKITNEEELKFTGKAINDQHPRTCMGYTNDGYFINMVIQGRFPGLAEGATLEQEARLLRDLGCIEALNLDGGGSCCMRLNGK
jgi:exopolysaccharide biosynthesis protein